MHSLFLYGIRCCPTVHRTLGFYCAGDEARCIFAFGENRAIHSSFIPVWVGRRGSLHFRLRRKKCATLFSMGIGDEARYIFAFGEN